MANRSKKNTVLVLGASRLGAAIAALSSKQGIYAVIVDKDKEAFKKVDPNFSGFFIEGNAESLDVLDSAHIDEAKEVDIVTGDDNTNIFLACLIESLYPVPYINVRLIDTSKQNLLPQTRVHVISPYSLSLDLYASLRNREV